MHHFESINAEKHKKRQQPPNCSDNQNSKAATLATRTVLSEQKLLRSIAYSKMKTFALSKRLSVSTVFLVLIIVAIVIANETHQKDCINCVDAADEYAVKKRGGLRTCYAGKCPRRRSRKRGMKMNLAQFEKELQDFESTNTENFNISPAETRTKENEKKAPAN